MNILEHVEHHAERVDHVPSVQHVDAVADQNVNVHDVALSGKKNAFYVVLVLNYRLVIVKKKKKSMPIYPIHLFLQQSPL